jgi:flagellar basal body-associated protein FliL
MTMPMAAPAAVPLVPTSRSYRAPAKKSDNSLLIISVVAVGVIAVAALVVAMLNQQPAAPAMRVPSAEEKRMMREAQQHIQEAIRIGEEAQRKLDNLDN